MREHNKRKESEGDWSVRSRLLVYIGLALLIGVLLYNHSYSTHLAPNQVILPYSDSTTIVKTLATNWIEPMANAQGNRWVEVKFADGTIYSCGDVAEADVTITNHHLHCTH